MKGSKISLETILSLLVAMDALMPIMVLGTNTTMITGFLTKEYDFQEQIEHFEAFGDDSNAGSRSTGN